jgi:hypothetical protein
MAYWFIGGILALLAVLLLGRSFVRANPAALAYRLRRTTGYLLAGLALVFFVTGRMALAVPLGLGAAVLLGLRGFPAAGGGNPNPSPGNTSQVETEWLEMTLDHASGGFDGTVRKGRHAGKRLGELTREQVIEVLQECRGEAQSATLLETYLDRVHGADWRGTAEQPGAEPPPRSGRMSREEALQMLGLRSGASEAEIKDAHRRLMMKVHPDQGGSDYLAAKLNEAKDVLLGA